MSLRNTPQVPFCAFCFSVSSRERRWAKKWGEEKHFHGICLTYLPACLQSYLTHLSTPRMEPTYMSMWG